MCKVNHKMAHGWRSSTAAWAHGNENWLQCGACMTNGVYGLFNRNGVCETA